MILVVIQMNIFLSKMRNYIKGTFLYPFVKPVWDFYFKHTSKILMNKYAEKALVSLKSILDEHYIIFWPDYGTLLGIYREHDFISHDCDIDIGMFGANASNVMLILCNSDFVLSHQYSICKKNGDEKIIQLTYKYHSLTIDMYFYERINDNIITTYQLHGIKPKQYDNNNQLMFQVYQYNLPLNTFSSIVFKDIEYRVPTEIEKYLIALYGENFMIPDPNYKEDISRYQCHPLTKIYGIAKYNKK